MSAPLLNLALEAAALVDTLRAATSSGEVMALITKYNASARADAERATTQERSSRDRVMTLNEDLQAAKRDNLTDRAKTLAAALTSARGDMEASAAAAAQATSDFTSGERLARRAERERSRAWPLAAAGIPAFIAERLRQIDEVVGGWGGPQPQRDVSLAEGLRVIFKSLAPR